MKENQVCCNHQIKGNVVVLINNNEDIGTIDKFEAIKIANNQGLDLIQVGFRDGIPVCKPMDYGKLKYQQSKKHHSKEITTKEVKFRVVTDVQDFNLKQKKIAEFLEKGYHVKVSIELKGREVEFRSAAIDKVKLMINPFLENVEEPKINSLGRTISTILIHKRKNNV